MQFDAWAEEALARVYLARCLMDDGHQLRDDHVDTLHDRIFEF